MESRDRDKKQQDVPSSSASVVPLAADEQGGNHKFAYEEPDLLGDMALLGLGLLLEGSNLAMRNVSQKQVRGDSVPQDHVRSPSREIARRALIGLVVEGRARALARQEARRQARRQFARRMSALTEPLTHWFPVDVTLALADILVGYSQDRVASIVDRLAEHGRVEEERARVLAQQAFDGWVDEALAYFAHNPDVRELVTQQGEEAAYDALDGLRTRSQSVDTWLAEFTRRLLQRSKQSRGAPTTPEPAPTVRVEASGSGA